MTSNHVPTNEGEKVVPLPINSESIIFLLTDSFNAKNASFVRSRAILDVLVNEFVSLKVVSLYPIPDLKVHHKFFWNFGRPPRNIKIRFFTELMMGIWTFFILIIICKRDSKVFIPVPSFLVSIFAVLAVRIRRGKYMIDVRDLYPWIYKDQFPAAKKHWISRQLYRLTLHHVYSNAFAITAVTNRFRTYFDRLGFETYFLPNGVSKEAFESYKRKNYSNLTVFCVAGNLGRYQDVDLLREVVNSLMEKDNVELHIVGFGLHSDFAQSEKCIIHGHLNQKEYYELLSVCDVGLSFRTTNLIGRSAIPVRIFDYMAMGITTIASPKGDALHFFNGCKSIHFFNGNIDEIDLFIDSYLSSKEKHSSLSHEIHAESRNYLRSLKNQLVLELMRMN